MYELVPVEGEIMKDFYPEVTDKQEFIMKVIKNEEERFHETLTDGMAILSGVIDKAKSSGYIYRTRSGCIPSYMTHMASRSN